MKTPARRSKRLDSESEPKVTTRVALRAREKNCSKTRAVRVRPEPEYPQIRTASEMKLMPPEFFQIDALDLAPRLLGKFLRRDNVVLRISEVRHTFLFSVFFFFFELFDTLIRLFGNILQ